MSHAYLLQTPHNTLHAHHSLPLLVRVLMNASEHDNLSLWPPPSLLSSPRDYCPMNFHTLPRRCDTHLRKRHLAKHVPHCSGKQEDILRQLYSRATERGCFKRGGGGSRSGLVLPFLSFLSFFVPFGTFPIFPGFSRFARGRSGNCPIRPFPLSRPIKSTYEEQSRKGPRHNLDLSRKRWETPGFGNPPV